jgi:hypothetical protein
MEEPRILCRIETNCQDYIAETSVLDKDVNEWNLNAKIIRQYEI